MTEFNNILKLISILFFTIFFGCSKFSTVEISGTGFSGPGLNLSLPNMTIRNVLNPVVTNSFTIDSLALTNSGGWSSSADSNRIGGSYEYILGDGNLHSISGIVNLTTRSRILIAHQVQTDSTELNIKLDGASVLIIPQGTSVTGWTTTDLGSYDAGTYTLSAETSDPWPKFVYLDGFIILSSTDRSAGVQQKGWLEENHSHIHKVGNWAVDAKPSVFPYSVVSTTDVGTIYSSNTNDSISVLVKLTSAGAIRVYGIGGTSNGVMNVLIDGVAQTSFDQYRSSNQYRIFTDYTVSSGEHLLQLKVSGTKNINSAGYNVHLDAIEIREVSLTDDERALAMADSIANNILSDGAGRISYDSDLYNQDNDSGYSLMALALAVGAGPLNWTFPTYNDKLL